MGCTSSISVPETERRIVLFGKAGDGKSSTANTILGENVFASASKVRNQKAERTVYGRKVTLIDTPGFCDTDCDEEHIKSEMVKSLIECAPGVDAFIMVLKVSRYTSEENEVLQKFLNMFKEGEVLKHTVIVFTSGENLQGQSIEEFVEQSAQLQELVDQCEGRCHVIDNRHWNKRKWGKKSNRVQVKNLLNTIDEMVGESGIYTDPLLQNMEENIQDEIKNVAEGHAHPEEKREKAKKNVHLKILTTAIGVAAGAVIGIFSGIRVATVAVLTIVNSFSSLQTKFTAVGLAGAAGVALTSGAAAAAVAGAGGVVGAVYGGITAWNAAGESESLCKTVANVATYVLEGEKSIVERIENLSS